MKKKGKHKDTKERGGYSNALRVQNMRMLKAAPRKGARRR